MRVKDQTELDYIQHRAERGDQKAIDDLNSLIAPNNLLIWNAFNHLSASRPQAVDGIAAIQISEINAYLDLVGINDRAQKMRFLSGVQAMDSAFINQLSSKE